MEKVFGETGNMQCYIKDYPRPQFVRGDWENLNGDWDFRFDDANVGEQEKWYQSFQGTRKITVPFSYETKMSGIEDETVHENVWYSRVLCVDEKKLQDNRYILHFEGSDFITKVWVNGQFVGSHRGGYTRFSFDLTDVVVDGDNLLVVKIEDSFDMQQPRGKQRWMPENFLCFYVQTTGIWKTVWSEYVPNLSLEYVKMTPNIEEACLEVEYTLNIPTGVAKQNLLIEAEVSFEGKFINKVSVAPTAGISKARIDLCVNDSRAYGSSVKLWRPGQPYLYDVKFTLRENDKVWDEIGSYFAMREITIRGSEILLNGRALYQRLILDQGYWKDSHLTPPSEEALVEDIDKILAMGYNGLRKHQKTEDERFFYWCDVKGVLVWCEAPSTYQFSDYAVNEFANEWMDIVKQYYNHPCVITWTPFNESWGITMVRSSKREQFFTESIYYLTKSFDPNRPVIVNDGWEHTISDILTLHDYEESGDVLKKNYIENKEEFLNSIKSFCGLKMAFADGYCYQGQPILISEYGGIAFNNDDSGWGYGGKVQSEEDFICRFDCITSAIGDLPYVCGYCYTQVTDVQQEINGLMDIERNFKVDSKVIKKINERQKRGVY